MLNKISLFVLVLAQLFIAGVVFAQSLPGGAVATVNGQPISAVMYEQNLRANLAQGLKDSPQLRQTVKEELINRELLAQYAEKIGLDKTPEAQLQLKQVRENLLVENADGRLSAAEPDYRRRDPGRLQPSAQPARADG